MIKKRRKRMYNKIIVSVAMALLLGVGCYNLCVSSTPAVAGITANDTSSNSESSEASSTSSGERSAVNGWESADADKEYVYCVGSVSKIYSTAAVMRLVDDGKVELDKPVTEYIPDFKMADARYKNITVRMLMNHTSGLMGTSVKSMLLYDDDDHYSHDHLLEELSIQRLKADPGKYASYCNDGFDLLSIIVERVTGMSFTDYVKEYIAAPTGGTRTGSGFTYKEFDDLVPAYLSNYNCCEQNVTTSIGAGGVYATAADTARFGTGFFKGNTSILSERSKLAMSKCWNSSDEYMDECGLGWDSVSEESFQKAGVQVLGKGGDSGLNHAYLMVAPESRVSIAVQSNNGSSALDGLIAQMIMKIVLEEKGIDVSEEQDQKHEIVSEIPASYDAYAGSYLTVNEAGELISRISFPDHAYMHVENIGPLKTDYVDYALCDDGRFYELAYEVSFSGLQDRKLAMNANAVTFIEGNDGKTYIAGEQDNMFPGIGSYRTKSYVGERLEENPVESDAMSTWESLDGAVAVLSDEIFSSAAYDHATASIVIPEEYPGYVYVMTVMGTRLLKISDAAHALAFQTIPSSRNRDLTDVSIFKDDDGIKIGLSFGLTYQLISDIPEFNSDMKEIKTETGKAKWYRIGDDLVNTSLSIKERPENSAVYVYNKFGEVVYTSHITDMTDELPMPEGGLLLFLGGDGGTISL